MKVNKKTPQTENDKRRAEKLTEIYKDRKSSSPELNQKKIAEMLDMSESAVSRIFSGALSLSHITTLKLATILRCHPSEFHEEFVDLTFASSAQNASYFRQFEKLSASDQETVRSIIDSLSQKGQ